MATLTINESEINDSGTDQTPSWTEKGTAGNTFAVQSTANAARLTLTGTANDVVLIEGKSTDYTAKLSGKTLTLVNSNTNQIITLALTTDSVVNFAFLDGSLDMSLASKKLGAQTLTTTATKITAAVAADNTSANEFFNPTTTSPGVTGEDNVFTLTEVAPTLTKTFLWDGVDTTALKNLVSYANQIQNRGGDKVTTTTSNDTAAGAVDGTFFDPAYVDLLNNIITSVKYANLVDEKLTANPAFLSTSGKTVGVIEGGVHTTANDDLIVAGTSYALNGAYINGGAGNDTLEVEMKGPFAQPKQLLSIETVKVHNVANYYDSASFGLNNTGRNPNGGVNDITKIQLDGGQGGVTSTSTHSILDLTNARSLKFLDVSESEASGALTVLGIKNYPVTTLEGGFTNDVNLHYTTGQKAVLDLKLVNVNFTGNSTGTNSGTTAGQLNIAHNAGHIRINSDGFSNVLDSVDFGAKFQKLTVTGAGQLIINSELNFDNGVATIDAATNTGGLTVNLATAAGTKISPLKAITINGSTADDTITINDTAPDGVALKINLGTGENVLNIDKVLNAGAKSVITGDNLTLNVNFAGVNLTRANISGVDAVVIKDTIGAATPALTITAAQLKALGADKFVSDHNTNTSITTAANVNLKIVVTASTSLSDLIDVTKLDSNVKLSFDIAKDATLTLTAEQLDKYVAHDGINSTGVDNGKVVINNAGLKFDAFDAVVGDLAGTVAAGQNDFVINRSITGYDRPAVATGTDTLVIDSGALPVPVAPATTATPTPLSVVANNTSAAQFQANVGALVLNGANDVNFTAPVKFGTATTSVDNFKLDASALTGKLNGLKIVDFNKITVGADTTWGSVKGTAGVDRIEVTLSGDVGTGATVATGGLKSSGVETYVVTGLDANRTFNVCDTTEGLVTLGLQGNAGKAVTFNNVKFNVGFIMEGDGKTGYETLPKAAGNPNYSNVGTLNAKYYTYDENFTANVSVSNQGKSLGLQTDGLTERVLHVDGINIDNAKAANITITDGDVVIAGINSTGANELQSVKLTSANDVTVTLNATANNLTKFDASAVVGDATVVIGNTDGLFTPTYGDDTSAVVDLSKTAVTGVDFVKIIEGGTLSLSLAQLTDIGASDITVIDGNDGNTTAGTATLNLTGLDETVFSVSNFSAGITLGSISIVDRTGDTNTANDVVTLNAATTLTNVPSLTIPAGMTLNLTAAQFQQLAGKGTVANSGTINITDLKQADVDAGLDLSGITNAGAGKFGTITLAENVVLKAGTNLNAAKLIEDSGIGGGTQIGTIDGTESAGVSVLTDDRFAVLGNTGFAITLAANQELTLATEAQAHNRVVNGATGTKVTFSFTAATAASQVNFVDGNHTGGILTGLNLANFSNVGTLSVLSSLVQNNNVEQILGNLNKSTLVLIDNVTVAGTAAAATHRNVDVATGDTVSGNLIFQNLNYADPAFVKLTKLDISMKGGSTITGNLDIPGGLVADSKTGFDTLTINSQGSTANTITGNITAGTNGLATENNLLNVAVNATTNLSVGTYNATTGAATAGNGSIVFTSVNDALVTGSDSATANFTVTGAGNVKVTQLDVSDNDVDVLNVTNSGTGTLTVTGASPAIKVSTVAETVNLKGTGAMKFGTVTTNATTGLVTDIDPSVAATAALTINAATATGAVDLGTVTVSDDFTFTAGTGKTTLTLGGDDSASGDGDTTTAVMGADDVWTVDMSTAAAASTLTIDNSTTFGAGLGSQVDIKLGTTGNNTVVFDGTNTIGNVDKFSITGTGTLQVKGALDFRTIGTTTNATTGVTTQDLTLGDLDIVLAAGASIQMTDAQYAAFVAAGGTISGAGTTLLVSDAISAGASIDLTEYRGITAVQVDKTLTDTLKLTDDQAKVATIITNAAGVVTAATWDDPDVTGTTNPHLVGDLRDLAAGATVTVLANGTADLTTLRGLDAIDIQPSTSAAVTISATAANDQLAALGGGVAALTDLQAANSLVVKTTVANSFRNPVTNALAASVNDVNFTVTHDATTGAATAVAVSGIAGAIDSAFNGFYDGASGATTTGDTVFQTLVSTSGVPTAATTVSYTAAGSMSSGVTSSGNLATSQFAADTIAFVAEADPTLTGGNLTAITNFVTTATNTATPTKPIDVLNFEAFLTGASTSVALGVAAGNAVKQVSTVTVAGAVEANETITIGGVAAANVVVTTGADATTTAAAIKTAIDAAAGSTVDVTVAAGVVTLTAKVAGTGFTPSVVSITDGTSATPGVGTTAITGAVTANNVGTAGAAFTNKVSVVALANVGGTLDTGDFAAAGTAFAAIANGDKGVVITSDVATGNKIYYVYDSDATAGVTAAVTLVGTIDNIPTAAGNFFVA